jgi:hypothetical protein
MQRDQVALRQRLTEHLRRLLRNIVVRRAVKAVAAHVVLAIEIPGDRIAIGRARHGLVKGGIEHRHLRHAGEQLPRHQDTVEIGRIVQRRQRNHLPDRRDHVVIHHRRRMKRLAAMHDAMTDGYELIEPAERAGVRERGADALDAGVVRADGGRLLARLGAAVGVRPGQLQRRRRLADAGRIATGGHPPILAPLADREEPELDRRAAGVQHQYFHEHSLAWRRAQACAAAFCAWMAVMVTVLTMSVTVQPRLRSFTGLFRPWSTGPMATAPALRCTAL